MRLVFVIHSEGGRILLTKKISLKEDRVNE